MEENNNNQVYLKRDDWIKEKRSCSFEKYRISLIVLTARKIFQIAYWALLGFLIGENFRLANVRKTTEITVSFSIEDFRREIEKLQKHISIVDNSRFGFDDLKEANGETFFAVLNVHTQWEKQCHFEGPLVMKTNPLVHDLMEDFSNETRTVTVLYGRNSLIRKGESNEYLYQKLEKFAFVREKEELTLKIGENRFSHDRNIVNLILPLKGRSSTFSRFLKNFEKMRQNQTVKLTLAIHEDSLESTQLFLEKNYHPFLNSGIIKIVPCKLEPFSRAECISKGIDTLELSDLFFICDVDLILNENAIQVVRSFSAENRIFFPIIFSEYEQSFEERKIIAENQGYWRSTAYGMVAMTKQTYLQTPGFNLNLTGWGGEDVLFAEEILKSKIEFFRGNVVDIVHPWHPKNCSLSNQKHSASCLAVRALNMMSSKNLLKKYYQSSFIKN
ncbi:Oidioi.mRNA.OKI2018_I69.chr1.g906.t1.cds [Oikopleura dioica]|uniref:Hexosyltransferase n=1 Tax=Oikopleura dioica TaxID=34765 RepID=A0ABN7SSP3_OIKDI|nr:Oidioi.mRNA.OKI2018_I69.chr1.g906.t1.cds [Oikopleura dioica]